jgi:hypothetical protein
MKLVVTTSHPSLHEHRHPDRPDELHPNLGRLIQPRHTSSIENTAFEGITWAADNDCFQGLDEPRYRAMLERIAGLPGCQFVTVPDVVADAATTLRLFEKWQPILEGYGLPMAFVLQDGVEDVGAPLELVDAVFVGGSTEFKLGPVAAQFAQAAKRAGKWVHWGRVNTRKRFDYIASTGAVDSFDGSKFARWRKTYLDVGLSWCLEYDRRIELDLSVAA